MAQQENRKNIPAETKKPQSGHSSTDKTAGASDKSASPKDRDQGKKKR